MGYTLRHFGPPNAVNPDRVIQHYHTAQGRPSGTLYISYPDKRNYPERPMVILMFA